MNLPFSNSEITAAISSPASRRDFLRRAGLAGTTAALASATASLLSPSKASAATIVDSDILNFALNLEYLEAEFYARGVYGKGISEIGVGITGLGTAGATLVKAGSTQVPFTSAIVADYALEVTNDEIAHVSFLRQALGSAAIAKPEIDLVNSFNALAVATGLGSSFDPFASQNNFLLAAFIFEDVGVTAYTGAAPLLASKDYIPPAAGILVVEAHHAALLRSTLYNLNYSDSSGSIAKAVNLISQFRDSLDGAADLDQGITNPDGTANIVPTDVNGLTFSRSTRQVLNIVYASPGASKGGFFPAGVNGAIQS